MVLFAGRLHRGNLAPWRLKPGFMLSFRKRPCVRDRGASLFIDVRLKGKVGRGRRTRRSAEASPLASVLPESGGSSGPALPVRPGGTETGMRPRDSLALAPSCHHRGFGV